MLSRRKFLSAILTLFLSIFIMTGYTFATGDAGGQEGGGGSSTCSTNKCYSQNYGAAWVYYELPPQSEVGERGTTLTMPFYTYGGSASVDVGICSEVGGFWLLGLISHDPANNPTGTQMGAIPMRYMAGYGGTTPWLSDAGDLSNSNKDYAIAKKIGSEKDVQDYFL